MNIKRITAIVPIDMLTSLEKQLRECGVPGVTVEHVQGYGEHPNYFRRDLMQENARVVLYADKERVDDIVAAITDCARESGAMGGILAVERIERLVHLTDGTDVTSASL
ncbi:MAG: P-II family nitrogen regulator [Woeseia sp.]